MPNTADDAPGYGLDVFDPRKRFERVGFLSPDDSLSGLVAARWSDDNNWVTLGSTDGTVKIFDLRKGLDARTRAVVTCAGASRGLPDVVGQARVLETPGRRLVFAASCASHLVVHAWTPPTLYGGGDGAPAMTIR